MRLQRTVLAVVLVIGLWGCHAPAPQLQMERVANIPIDMKEFVPYGENSPLNLLVGSALNGSGKAVRLYYQASSCPQGRIYPQLSYPDVRTQAAPKNLTGLAAVRAIFGDDKSVAVTEAQQGIVRIVIGDMDEAILKTRIARLTFKTMEQYDGADAIGALLHNADFVAALSKLGASALRFDYDNPGRPLSLFDTQPAHLPDSLSDVTVEEALDRIATTFGGVAVFASGDCPGGRRYDLSFSYIPRLPDPNLPPPGSRIWTMGSPNPADLKPVQVSPGNVIWTNASPEIFAASMRSQQAALENVTAALKGGGKAAVLTYGVTACNSPDNLFMLFPDVRSQPAVKGETGLAAMQSVFRDDRSVAVTEAKAGIIRIALGKIDDGLLQTRISEIKFTPDEQYNEQDAMAVLLGNKDLQAAARTLGITIPGMVIDHLVQTPMDGVPHLPPSLRDVTVEQVLEQIATTFSGVALYGGEDCPQGKQFNLGFWYVPGARPK